MSESIILKTGERYCGCVDEDGLPHGGGTLTYNDLYSYAGLFDTGCARFGGVVSDPQGVPLNGYFERVYHKSAEYKGDYVNGQLNGYGLQKFTESGWYEGEFEDDRRNGTVIFTSDDGRKEEQLWAGGDLKSTKKAGRNSRQRRKEAERRRLK